MNYHRSFIRWPGSKFRALPSILKHLPEGRGLVEPFVGAGNVFINTDYDRYLLGDADSDLMGMYSALKHDFDEFCARIENLLAQWGNTSSDYYQVRALFNHETDQRERSALMYWLSLHSFNGLVRRNRKNEFNVPFGSISKPAVKWSQLELFHKKLKRATLICDDFRVIMKRKRKNYHYYLDPPYSQLTRTANFAGYQANSFTHKDHQDLANLAINAQKKGSTILISNHDTPETRKLYAQATKVKSFTVSRSISAKSTSRGPAKELLAIYT